MYDWNDLKVFLAVARGGSTLSAAKALGVNQTTVARRIESLEHAMGFKLFERGQSGSRLTENGQSLVADAEQVERAAIRFGNTAAGQLRGVAGALRLTAVETMANNFLIPALVEFRQAHPEIQIDLVVTERLLDIGNGEADLAIRSGQTLTDPDLVARKFADHEMALYCSRSYAKRCGVPASLESLKDHDLIDIGNEQGTMPGAIWMIRQAGGKTPVTRANNMASLVQAVKAGLGVGPLPTSIGDPDVDLIRCSECIDEARASSWLLTRRDLKDTPRVRAFIDFMAPVLQREIRKAAEAGRRRLEEEAATVVPFATRSGT